ncbi:MAG TPA: hypothetical protein VGM77_10630 [Gemmatimonadales bacterium]|jgi:hypothetical protein
MTRIPSLLSSAVFLIAVQMPLNAQQAVPPSTVNIAPGTSVTINVRRGTVVVVGVAVPAANWFVTGIHPDRTSSLLPPGRWNRSVTSGGQLQIDIDPPDSIGLASLVVHVAVPNTVKQLRVHTTTGDVNVSAFDGDVVVATDSGSFQGTTLRGAVIAETLNGPIELTLPGVQPYRAVDLMSRNGGVTLNIASLGGTSLPDLLLACAPDSHLPPHNDASTTTLLAYFGIAAAQNNCSAGPAAAASSAPAGPGRVNTIAGTWRAGGAVVSLRALKGNILIRATGRPQLTIATNGFEQAFLQSVSGDSSVTIAVGRGSLSLGVIQRDTSSSMIGWSAELTGIDGKRATIGENGWFHHEVIDGSLHIEATPPGDSSASLALHVTVPRSVKRVHVIMTKGDVTVSGFGGDLVVESDSGNVVGTGLGGGVDVDAENGAIDVGVNGNTPRASISLFARNGPLRLATPSHGKGPSEMRLTCPVQLPPNDHSEHDAIVVDAQIISQVIKCEVGDVAGSKRLDIVTLMGRWSDGHARVELTALQGGITLRQP